MINKEIQDYIDYLLFLKYDRQLIWSNTTIAEMSDKHFRTIKNSITSQDIEGTSFL